MSRNTRWPLTVLGSIVVGAWAVIALLVLILAHYAPVILGWMR